jgi:hypothetical protein
MLPPVEHGFPAVYHIDNPGKLMDNRRNQVNSRVDPCSSAGQERNLNPARFAPVETVGQVADSKMHGGTVSV